MTHCLLSAAVGSSRFVLKNTVIGDWLPLRSNSLYIYFLVWASILFERQIVFVANRAYTNTRKYISSNRNCTVHNAYETHTSCDADLPTFQRFRQWLIWASYRDYTEPTLESKKKKKKKTGVLDGDDVLRDAKTYYSTRRRISENISLKNETRLTDFSARALPMLNLIAVCSGATGGRDLTVVRSFHAFHSTL